MERGAIPEDSCFESKTKPEDPEDIVIQEYKKIFEEILIASLHKDRLHCIRDDCQVWIKLHRRRNRFSMVHDQIRYDILVQDALRSVIRKVLSEVAKAGLPGDHHFFITFLTNAPGVKISSRLKERYPDQMTIVLQHQFWDLNVSESGFEVSLSFGDVPERLVIPFSAVQVFYDPTAAFEAAFDLASDLPKSDNDSPDVKTLAKETEGGELTILADKKDKKKSAVKLKSHSKTETEKDGQQTAKEKKPSADVVSLDAFRKK